jgi:hypothetical protein
MYHHILLLQQLFCSFRSINILNSIPWVITNQLNYLMEKKSMSFKCGVNLLLWSPNIHDSGLHCNNGTLACTTWFSLFLCLTNGTFLRKFETVASNLVSDYSAQKIHLTYVIYMWETVLIKAMFAFKRPICYLKFSEWFVKGKKQRLCNVS